MTVNDEKINTDEKNYVWQGREGETVPSRLRFLSLGAIEVWGWAIPHSGVVLCIAECLAACLAFYIRTRA